jgi:hypothetical protein
MFRPDRGRKHLCLSKNVGIIEISSVGKSLFKLPMRYKYQNLRCVYWQQRFRDTGKQKGNRVAVGNQNLIVKTSKISKALSWQSQ